MNIFFDVDQTLLSLDGGLRPGVRDVFQRLTEEGHTLYVWSGNGIRWDFVDRYQLRESVSGCFFKPLYNFWQALQRSNMPVVPDACVDDAPEVVEAFGGVVVSPYGMADPHDTEMERVYHILSQRGAPR